MGDVTKRRGRVLGMGASEEKGMQALTAEVPIAEMGDFTTVLRSVTADRGHYTLSFARYEQAPQPVADKVIADRAAEDVYKRQALDIAAKRADGAGVYAGLVARAAKGDYSKWNANAVSYTHLDVYKRQAAGRL